MALIIEGDMPKQCWSMRTVDGTTVRTFCQFFTACKSKFPYDVDYRPSDCPIKGEIPDKHGRIIDAGPLEKLYDNLEADNGIYMEDAGETLQRILDASTILEAST